MTAGLRESVWDYPRPPRLEPSNRRIRVVLAGETIVDTTTSHRILETSHPPVFYVAPDDVTSGVLRPDKRRTFCEFKGLAHYWNAFVGGVTVPAVAWSYPEPSPGYEAIAGHLAFYLGRVDACYVDTETVVAQAGDFYGGWITSDVVGPFKGEAGTAGW